MCVGGGVVCRMSKLVFGFVMFQLHRRVVMFQMGVVMFRMGVVMFLMGVRSWQSASPRS